MSSDYGYINARVRGLKSRLLGDDFYASAMSASDFSAFTSSLAQTPYMRELEEAQSRYSGLSAVDEALARNFYATTRSILNFSDGQPHQLISLMLLRYDLNNIKAVARAKHAGRDAADIESALFPAGQLKPALLENIAAAPDMAGVAQALAIAKTPLRSAFIRAVNQYQSDNDLYQLELALDKAYFRLVFEGLDGANAPEEFVRHFRREVDATNLRTALKLRGQGATEDDLFIAGGKEVNRVTFEAIMNDESSSALQALSGTSFAAVADTTSLSEAETVIRAVLDKSASRLAADPLDIGVVVSYLRAKEAETSKLRLLARGKYYGVPRQALERELGNA